MAGFKVIVDDRAVRARLKKLEAATGDLTTVLKAGGEVLKNSVEQNFEVGGRPKWKPLSEATANRRISEGGRLRGFTPILFVHGFLKNVTLQVSKDRAVLGTQPNTKAYAAIQQFGGKAGRGHKVKIPPRPFLVLQDADKEEILDLLDRHIQKALRE